MTEMRDYWLEEMLFTATLQPQMLVLSKEAEEYGCLTRGMKVVLTGGCLGSATDVYTEYTIEMDCLVFKEYNVAITRKWYRENHSNYDFEANMDDYIKRLGHQKYGHGIWPDYNRSIFDKRFTPKPYFPPEVDKEVKP